MHKARLPSIAFRRFRQEFSNFFQLRQVRQVRWRADYGQRRTKTHRPPTSKNLPRNIKIGKMLGKLGNLLMFLAVVWPRERPACLANWKTQFFFRTQHSLPRALTATNEFANRGKLSGKVANSFWQRDALLYSTSSNVAHGRPRTNADKRKASGCSWPMPSGASGATARALVIAR
jgi:hypothetical protein